MTAETPAEEIIVSWKEIFDEGERRIHQYFLDATVITDPQDRVRLLTRRRIIKQRMNVALQENNPQKLQRALREQVFLLSHISQLCIQNGVKPLDSFQLPVQSV